jgi:hydrogenase/urease accessory protein HupE
VSSIREVDPAGGLIRPLTGDDYLGVVMPICLGLWCLCPDILGLNCQGCTWAAAFSSVAASGCLWLNTFVFEKISAFSIA